MEGCSQAHEIAPSAVYTALAPNRFKDFWQELASSLDDFVISKVAGE
jgi:hypothetical protein